MTNSFIKNSSIFTVTRFILPSISLPNQTRNYYQTLNTPYGQVSTSHNQETIPHRVAPAQPQNSHHGIPNGTSNATVNSAGNNQTSEEMAVRELFPCNSPVNDHMRLDSRRRESFLSNVGTPWPSHRLRASIEQIVQAGFYYLGMSLHLFTLCLGFHWLISNRTISKDKGTYLYVLWMKKELVL